MIVLSNIFADFPCLWYWSVSSNIVLSDSAGDTFAWWDEIGVDNVIEWWVEEPGD